jgi:hypothetical protein
MSQIKANDLTNVTGGIPTVKGQQLIPTAWVNFNGTGTVAIRDSEGVSSIGDNGTGYYTVNFTNAMANADYNVVGSCAANEGVQQTGMVTIHSTPAAVEVVPTTSAFNFISVNVSAATFDSKHIAVAILGGQA